MVHSQRSAVIKRTEYIQPKVISNTFMCFACASLGPRHNALELQHSFPLHCVLSAPASQGLAFKVPKQATGSHWVGHISSLYSLPLLSLTQRPLQWQGW